MEENAIPLFFANFHPADSLIRLWEEPTRENVLRFFSEIKNARYLVPCVSKQSDGRSYPAVLSTQEGEDFLPAFSDREELGKWPFGKGKVCVYSFDDLKHTMLEYPHNLAGIAVNPFGKALLLRQSQIVQIDVATQGMSMHKVKHDRKLGLWGPKSLPPRLVGGLKDFFSRKREVRLVYLLLAQGQEAPVPHWFFLIDFDGTESGLFPQVAEVVQPYMKAGDSFELVKANSRLLQFAAVKAEPVYQR